MIDEIFWRKKNGVLKVFFLVSFSTKFHINIWKCATVQLSLSINLNLLSVNCRLVREGKVRSCSYITIDPIP